MRYIQIYNGRVFIFLKGVAIERPRTLAHWAVYLTCPDMYVRAYV